MTAFRVINPNGILPSQGLMIVRMFLLVNSGDNQFAFCNAFAFFDDPNLHLKNRFSDFSNFPDRFNCKCLQRRVTGHVYQGKIFKYMVL